MSKESLYEINVLIAGRKYPLVVNTKEEESVRELVKLLNQEIDEMHARYASRLSKQDIMAMLLLTYGKNLIEMNQKMADFEKQLARLDDLDNLLDEVLSK
jgi:cell division protein ZapA (FtsZ GTPase activity inhibitor)